MAGTEAILTPGGQSGDQTPNDPSTVTVTGYQDQGDTGRTGVSNPPNDPIETSEPTPQTQDPKAPQVTPEQPQQAPAATMQDLGPALAPPKLPDTWTTGEPQDQNANNPLVKKAGVMRSVMNALLPPTFTTTIDPNTGQATRTQVPRSKTDIGMAIALEAISGGLAGLSAYGPSNEGKAGLLGLQQGQAIARKQQEIQQNQDQQANADYANHLRAVETNMRTFNNARQVGREDQATNEKYLRSYDDLNHLIETQYPQASLGLATYKDFGKYNATKQNAIPYKMIPRPDPNNAGEQAKDANGMPLWDMQYRIIDPNFKATNLLTAKMRADGAKWNIQGLADADGNPTKLPDDLMTKLSTSTNVQAQIGAMDLFENELDKHYKLVNSTQPGGYKFQGGGNVDVPNDAGQADLLDAAAAKYPNVPKALLRSVAMQESGGRHIDPKTGKVIASGTGPTGIMQLAKSTAAQYKANPSDMAQNVDTGAHYLSDLIEQNHGDLKAALTTYSGGQTPGYVDQVLKRAGITNSTGTNSTGEQYKPYDLADAAKHDGLLAKAVADFQGYQNKTENIGQATQAFAKDNNAEANKIIQAYGGRDAIRAHDDAVVAQRQDAKDQAAEAKTAANAKVKDDATQAASAKMRAYTEPVTDPTTGQPFELADNIMDMDAGEARTYLSQHGVKIPPNFTNLWQTAHYMASAGHIPGKIWLKGTPDEMDAQTGLSYIGQFLNPQWDESNYQDRVNFRRVLDNPSAKGGGATIQSASNAAGHMTELSGLADALDQANNHQNIHALNEIANKVGAQVGDTPAVTYRAIAEAVGTEIAKVVATDKPPEEVTAQFIKALDPANSLQQNQNVLKYYTGLMQTRMQNLDESSHTILGQHLRTVGSPATKLFQQYGLATPWSNLPKGNNQQMSYETRDEFMKAAGGDKTLARQLAREYRWNTNVPPQSTLPPAGNTGSAGGNY